MDFLLTPLSFLLIIDGALSSISVAIAHTLKCVKGEQSECEALKTFYPRRRGVQTVGRVVSLRLYKVHTTPPLTTRDTHQSGD